MLRRTFSVLLTALLLAGILCAGASAETAEEQAATHRKRKSY